MVSQTTDTKEFDRAAFERDGFLVKKGFADLLFVTTSCQSQ